MKKKTLMAFTLSLFMSCLVMMSTLNTANAGKCQFTTVSEMVNALEGDYEVVWAGPILDHVGNFKVEEVDLFSKDVGAVVRIEAVLDSNELRNLVGYVIQDVPGSANRAVESISNIDEWLGGWETTAPLFHFGAIDWGGRREELYKDFGNGVYELRSKNGIEGTEWNYKGVSENTYYELAGNQLNFYYNVYDKHNIPHAVYFMKLRRVG